MRLNESEKLMIGVQAGILKYLMDEKGGEITRENFIPRIEMACNQMVGATEEEMKMNRRRMADGSEVNLGVLNVAETDLGRCSLALLFKDAFGNGTAEELAEMIKARYPNVEETMITGFSEAGKIVRKMKMMTERQMRTGAFLILGGFNNKELKEQLRKNGS